MMKIAVLGAGNIAWHLSRAFIKAGHPVKQVWNRNPEKAITLALEIGANSIQNIDEIKDEIDLILIAISDEGIEGIASQIKAKSHQIVVHTSGSTSIAVLESCATRYGVIYPLQTFSTGVKVDFSSIPIGVEANNEAAGDVLFDLMSAISNKVQFINSTQRIQLHLAAVFACNFTNHLYTIAHNLLSQSNLDFELIRPLIAETAKKVLEILPADAQTGPARRNDVLTINKHLNLLRDNPEWRILYESISQDIVKMYAKDQSSLK